MTIADKYFKGVGRMTLEQDPPHTAVEVRITPQLHTIKLTAVDMWQHASQNGMTPEQAFDEIVIRQLRDAAYSAALMVVAAGLSAVRRKEMKPEDVRSIVEWAIVQRDIQIERQQAEIERLQAQIGIKEVEIAALTRALKS